MRGKFSIIFDQGTLTSKKELKSSAFSCNLLQNHLDGRVVELKVFFII